MKKILVTGATGFLGSNLIRSLLKKGEGKIVGLKRPTSPMKLVEDFQSNVEWIDGDLLDIHTIEEAMQGVEEVYHTAAIISFHPGQREMMKKINIDGTANVVNACLSKKIKKLVHISSIAAIGRNDELLVKETNKWNSSNKTSIYGESKFMAELEVHRGIAEGLHANIINPSVIIGPGYWDQGTSRFFPRIFKGQKFYPLGSTGFVDVRDVAELCILLMNKDVVGQRVIANAINLSFLDFFNLVAEKLDVPGPSIKVNHFMANLAWRIEGLRSKIFNSTPFLTKETAKTAMTSYQFENHKSLELFDFKYRDIEQTVERTAKSYLQSLV